jgi:hypothetical protein
LNLFDGAKEILYEIRRRPLEDVFGMPTRLVTSLTSTLIGSVLIDDAMIDGLLGV